MSTRKVQRLSYIECSALGRSSAPDSAQRNSHSGRGKVSIVPQKVDIVAVRGRPRRIRARGLLTQPETSSSSSSSDTIAGVYSHYAKQRIFAPPRVSQPILRKSYHKRLMHDAKGFAKFAVVSSRTRL